MCFIAAPCLVLLARETEVKDNLKPTETRKEPVALAGRAALTSACGLGRLAGQHAPYLPLPGVQEPIVVRWE
jgi:hypothetical protein